MGTLTQELEIMAQLILKCLPKGTSKNTLIMIINHPGNLNENLIFRTNTPSQSNPPSLTDTEIMRMKDNNFIEAKNVMVVYDEILRNSTSINDLQGEFKKAN